MPMTMGERERPDTVAQEELGADAFSRYPVGSSAPVACSIHQNPEVIGNGLSPSYVNNNTPSSPLFHSRLSSSSDAACTTHPAPLSPAPLSTRKQIRHPSALGCKTLRRRSDHLVNACKLRAASCMRPPPIHRAAS